uniref:Uncharacterized protein n=1 Tax=Compsopogon caeruleus TaxID=31354 RepID=A0A7S1TJ29_9RHOD|mmetsp:Transcript_9637/g.19685  ORF Transcript_9637/g.19685 Transcript_9637/m.19685 type:complete len:240 (+) Transcript_9637:33-752(+)
MEVLARFANGKLWCDRVAEGASSWFLAGAERVGCEEWVRACAGWVRGLLHGVEETVDGGWHKVMSWTARARSAWHNRRSLGVRRRRRSSIALSQRPASRDRRRRESSIMPITHEGTRRSTTRTRPMGSTLQPLNVTSAANHAAHPARESATRRRARALERARAMRERGSELAGDQRRRERESQRQHYALGIRAEKLSALEFELSRIRSQIQSFVAENDTIAQNHTEVELRDGEPTKNPL